MSLDLTLLISRNGVAASSLGILSYYTKAATDFPIARVSAMEWAIKMLYELPKQQEALTQLVSLKTMTPLMGAVMSHDWPYEILHLVSRLSSAIGYASPLVPATLSQAMELSMILIDRSDRFLMESFRYVWHRMRAAPLESSYNVHAEPLVPLIAKHLPKLTSNEDALILVGLASCLATRWTLLREDTVFLLADTLLPLLLHENAEIHDVVVKAYCEILLSAGSPSTVKGFMKRDLVRPLISVILGEKVVELKTIACGTFVTLLSSAGSDDFIVACRWKGTIAALAHCVVEPTLVFWIPDAVRVLFVAVKDGPRVHRQYLYGNYYDGASSNPNLDYLYATIYDKLAQLNAATQNHPTLPLLVLLEAIGLPVPF